MSHATTQARPSRGWTAATVVAVAAGLIATSGAAEAAPATAPAFKAFAMPVTTSRAALAVSVWNSKPGTSVVVRDTRGKVLGQSRTSTGGKTIIPITMKPSSIQRLSVSVAGARSAQSVIAATTPPFVDTSSWRVVNKRTQLPNTFAPKDIGVTAGVPVAKRAAWSLTKMLRDANTQGVKLYASNAYRSYGWQANLYNSYVARSGRPAADTYSARPGYSEHQSGLSFDAKARNEKCSLQTCFGGTPEGTWLGRSAATYGFIVRYTPANTKITGYQPEPWHFRYVGTWLTAYLKDTKIGSLEQAFGLPAAPGYATT